jgi:hypothetical protein
MMLIKTCGFAFHKAWAIAGVLLAVLPISSVESQPIADGQSPKIIVTARSVRSLNAYVRKASGDAANRQIDRWHRSLCVKFNNFAAGPEAAIAEGVQRHGAAIGLKIRLGGCRSYGVIIVASETADALTSQLLAKTKNILGDPSTTPALAKQLQKTLREPRPIRWFTATETVSKDGAPMTNANSEGTMTNKAFSSSMISSTTRSETRSKLIVVDEDRVSGFTIRQLTDYIAFVVLGSPSLAADYAGSDTIMALFQKPRENAPVGLSQLDVLFLSALYNTPADRSADAQRGRIRRQIAYNLRIKPR